MGSLGEAGTSPEAERVYRALVAAGGGSGADLVDGLGLGPDVVGAATDELASLGLLTHHGDDLVPLPPRIALEAVAERRSREALAARTAALELGALWEVRDTPASFVEVVHTTDAVADLGLALMRETRTELRGLSIGPQGPRAPRPEVAPGVYELLDRGGRIRAVYGSRILQDPQVIGMVTSCIERGEEARVCPEVPVNLLVGETYALLTVPGRNGQRLNALVVHHSELYDRLVALFDVFWDLGVPLAATSVTPDDSTLRAESRDLLTCLAAGLTDESIAQKLGVSQRTVARRVATLQEHLAARSRFQLGVQAIRRGWL